MRTVLAVVTLALLSSTAHAFCGFFVAGSNEGLSNDASKVVLMRKGTRTVMTMSNDYKGPTADFAMVVPVPVVLQKEHVKTLPADVFTHIDQLSAPRLVEYWEQDPCAPFYDGMLPGGAMKGGVAGLGHGSGGGGMGVKIEAQFVVGEYQILVLSAQEASGLEKWLTLNHYKIPQGASAALAPYVKSGMKFFVAKVDITKVHKDAHGTVVLSPLRFDFEAPELRLPVRLGLLNSNGKQDLIVYVLSPDKRFEVANYPNVFVPTNLEVLDEVRKKFASFYAQLFDETMARAHNRAVVTEYAWQTSSCDPCPVPPLQQSDLATLGDYVLSGNTATPDKGMQSSQGGFYGSFSSWVLTRLHTRYAKETLSEDLVFHEAPAVVGGRASYDTKPLEQPGEVKPDSANNFQARYIIRHPFTGKVACKDPHFGNWGGPPGGEKKVTAASDLASAPRGGIDLKAVVRSKVTAANLPGLPPEKPRRP